MAGRNKSFLLVSLSLVLFAFLFVSGCETAKGAACGAQDGAKKDWENAKKTDAWLKKNLW
ncbi:MAG: hypothetical protein PHN57_03690 [Candidatus Omnitrophica bacterium]|nr:hypothetical protein [Candidatus Omnitrophota bacterium]